jgi:hypothetical protein
MQLKLNKNGEEPRLYVNILSNDNEGSGIRGKEMRKMLKC